MRDGWLRIGDLARMDENGHIYIEGRTKDLIISKGQNIYPAEIENVVKAMPDLADSTWSACPTKSTGRRCAPAWC